MSGKYKTLRTTSFSDLLVFYEYCLIYTPKNFMKKGIITLSQVKTK
jgi:hypothetical protein